MQKTYREWASSLLAESVPQLNAFMGCQVLIVERLLAEVDGKHQEFCLRLRKEINEKQVSEQHALCQKNQAIKLCEVVMKRNKSYEEALQKKDQECRNVYALALRNNRQVLELQEKLRKVSQTIGQISCH